MKSTHDGCSTTFAPMLAKCLCAGQAALNVISGQIDFMFANMPYVLGIVRARASNLAQQGADPMQGSVDQYAAFMRNELAKWAKVVAAAGLKVE